MKKLIASLTLAAVIVLAGCAPTAAIGKRAGSVEIGKQGGAVTHARILSADDGKGSGIVCRHYIILWFGCRN